MTITLSLKELAPTKTTRNSLRQLFRLSEPKKKSKPHSAPVESNRKQYDQKEENGEADEDVATLPVKPPRFQLLELPIDIRSSPFSKATFSAPISDLPRLQRLQRTKHESMEPFRLLDLPVELRLQILTHHIGTHRTIPITFNSEALVKCRHWFVYGLAHERRNSLAVLRACRQLQAEASGVLWDSTTFVIQVKDRALPPVTLGDQICLHLGRGIAFEKMRHAIFHIDASGAEWKGDTIDGLPEKLKPGEGLRTAELHFEIGQMQDSKLGSVEWALQRLTNLPVARLVKASCVGLVDLGGGEWRCVPCNELEVFKALIRKFKPYAPQTCGIGMSLTLGFRLDISEKQCGWMMPSFVLGEYGQMDTRVVNIQPSS